jgi:exoribonuclease R
MPVETRVERAIVRSDAQLTYPEVHHALESGAPPEALLLLREIGRLRQAAERARGGVSLPTPEQVVVPNGGRYRLEYDAPLPCEDWNAQISLLTGMEAARIMLAGGAGLLRTLPAPDERTLARLQRAAKALGVAWPEHGGYAAFVRAVDPSSPHGAALLVEAAHALRGAGYRGFDHGEVPADAHHAAVAAPYAHVTAPLRRLCDRAANEAVLAHVEGRALPEWVHQELALLPKIMADATRREGSYSRATLDLIEALVLRPWVHHEFRGVVVDVDGEGQRVQVQLRDPAVVSWATTPRAVAPGQEVDLVLLAADPVARRVDFAVC